MTEDQKYQGHLYREKPNKAAKRKSVSIIEPNGNTALVARQPTVEDELPTEVPPHVPTPPPAVASLVKNRDSVFDYLVDEEDSTPRIEFADEREEMFMKSGAPSVFSSRPTSRNEYRNKEERLASKDYEENGFTYGAEPINPRPANMNFSTTTLDFMTPAAKVAKAKLDRHVPDSAGHSRQSSNSEKKRKRAQTDEHTGDTVMPDAPATIVRSTVDTSGVVHSGLTGGLQRMMADKTDNFAYPRSPASSPDPDRRALAKVKPVKSRPHEHDPPSPLKKSRRSRSDDQNGLGISIKGRASRVMSAINGVLATDNVEGSVGRSATSRRRTSSSDEKPSSAVRGRDGERRERKKHKVGRHNGTSRDNVRMEHSSRTKSSTRRHGSESPDESKQRNGKSAQKAIEYHSHHRTAYSASDSDDERARQGDHHMVVFGAEERLRRKCEDFLAYISENAGGPRGYSINKTLKRYHKDSDIRKDNEKRDEEKELWKGLRLRRNDRGEVVIFVG